MSGRSLPSPYMFVRARGRSPGPGRTHASLSWRVSLAGDPQVLRLASTREVSMRLRPRLAIAAVALVLLAGSVSAALAQSSDVPDGEVLRNAQFVSKLLAARAHHLGVSAGPDPDTVYVGKSYTNHVAADNYWNVYTGTYRPGTNDANNAVWDWDNSVGSQAADSLHRGGTAGGGSNNRFPGYVDQADQMLYRDIAMLPSQSLTVSFNYRTRMSTSIGTTAATRTGWFHGDPLAVTSGNFISSSAAGVNASQDSFMVYVGAPVNDAACVYSDGVTRPVYDKQRRWFSEVLKTFGPGANYYEIFQKAGDNPADTLAATPTPSSGPIVIPAATISNVLGGVAGRVRLVFRVKTNRGFSDGDNRNSGYTSFGRGAVEVDNVTIDKGAGPVVIGDFETPQQGGVNAIDNRFPLPPALQITDVWRATAKAPPARMHVEPVSSLTYNDLCGSVTSPSRLCNIGGLIVTPGNHDDGEGIGDSRFTAWRECMDYIMSPTINLVGKGVGGATPNGMGITSSIANASDDIILWYDL